MNARLETWFDAILSRSPAQPTFLWRASHCLTVLAYHGIDHPNRFERHLDYLCSHTHPVSLEQVCQAIEERGGLPKRAVLVTFDDGDCSHLEFALPMMRERRIPGVVFVIAGLLNTDQPTWFEEVKLLARNGGKVNNLPSLAPENLVRALKRLNDDDRLAAIKELRSTASISPPSAPQLRSEDLAHLESAGIAIGNHSLTHPCLNHCTDEKIQDEVWQSHEILSNALRHHPSTFAYPNGDVDERVISSISKLGYKTAFLFDHRMSDLRPSNRFKISRVRVNSDTPMDRFKIIVSGLHSAIHHLRGLT